MWKNLRVSFFFHKVEVEGLVELVDADEFKAAATRLHLTFDGWT